MLLEGLFFTLGWIKLITSILINYVFELIMDRVKDRKNLEVQY